jgi:5-methyltetrahydropteroyltriglutamate--homocysteine methyltransferase
MPTEYRADQIGSLLRPPELLAAREAAAAGRMTAEELRRHEDAAILDAIEMQRQAGIDVYSDGELRRAAWMTDLADNVEGFEPERIQIEWHGPGGGVEGSHARVAGARLKQVRRLTGHETEFLRQHAPGPYKMTLPAASSFMHVGYKPGLTDRFYASREEFVLHVASLIRDELIALAEDGVPYLQLDAPYYCSYLDETLRDQLRAMGVDPERALEAAVEADNASLEGVAREGLVLGMHVCRGNSRSRWLAEGGYDRVAKQLFGSLRVDRFLLEYDSGRSGGFEPLQFVPPDKTVVLGLITTKEEQLESQDALVNQIEQASRYVPLERLALSPQCGFASVAAGNNISMEAQQRKLALVAATAGRVWG